MWFVSWTKIKLTAKLNAADTSLTADTDVWITAGRLYWVNNNQEEWIDFTWVAASWSNYTYSWLTRWLSQTADPATAWTWKTWIAWSEFVVVQMHDQMSDKQNGSPVAVYADATARDAAITSPSNWMSCYLTAEWVFSDYIWWAWTDRAADTTQNMSETVAWRWELWTQTENDNGTETWGTWAPLVTNPLRLWRSIQKQAYTYDEDTWAANAYVVTLTPAPTAYIEWMRISVKIWVWNTNTWASTINVNSLWAKAIQDRDWDALSANQLIEAQLYDLIYDGTQFKLITVEKASDSDVTTWTDTIKYASPKQLKDTYWQLYGTTVSVALEQKTSSWTYDYEIAIWAAWNYYEVWFTIWAWNTAGSPDAQAESVFVKWITWWDKTVWTSWTSNVNFWTQPWTPVFPTWSRKLTLPAVTYWSDSATINSITINWSWNLVINYTATLAAWGETQIDCYYANITN